MLVSPVALSLCTSLKCLRKSNRILTVFGKKHKRIWNFSWPKTKPWWSDWVKSNRKCWQTENASKRVKTLRNWNPSKGLSNRVRESPSLTPPSNWPQRPNKLWTRVWRNGGKWKRKHSATNKRSENTPWRSSRWLLTMERSSKEKIKGRMLNTTLNCVHNCLLSSVARIIRPMNKHSTAKWRTWERKSEGVRPQRRAGRHNWRNRTCASNKFSICTKTNLFDSQRSFTLMILNIFLFMNILLSCILFY